MIVLTVRLNLKCDWVDIIRYIDGYDGMSSLILVWLINSVLNHSTRIKTCICMFYPCLYHSLKILLHLVSSRYPCLYIIVILGFFSTLSLKTSRNSVGLILMSTLYQCIRLGSEFTFTYSVFSCMLGSVGVVVIELRFGETARHWIVILENC